MNVLLSAYSSDSRRGSESLVGYHYARILSEKHSISLITCAPTTVDFAERVEAIDLGERELNEVGRKDLMTWEIAQLPRARRLVREGAIDVIHRATPVSVNDPTLLCYLEPRFVLGPLLASGEAPESFRPYLWREVADYKQRASFSARLRPADRLASVGAGLLRSLGRHYAKAEAILVGTAHTADAIPARWRGKIVVIPHIAVETDLYLPPVEAGRRARPLVLYAGRLTGHKGLEILLRALASIKDEVEFEARIVGSGTPCYRAFLGSLATELGLDERLSFVPPIDRDELRSLIQACDVFCFPSMSDTYGVALLEAMSCARACVVADTGGPRDIVAPGCGIKLPLESPDQYIRDYGASVKRLLLEPSLREDLGGRARELMVSRNRWEVVAGILHGVYDEIERRG